MPVNTQPNVALTLTLDGTSVECQVIDATFTPPGVGASTVTETACPDGRVSEPGTIASGGLTGNVFADSQDGGVTWILLQAYDTNATIAYVVTWWADLGPTKAVQYTGDARVANFQLAWTKPAMGRHPIDLEIMTATVARPAAA